MKESLFGKFAKIICIINAPLLALGLQAWCHECAIDQHSLEQKKRHAGVRLLGARHKQTLRAFYCKLGEYKCVNVVAVVSDKNPFLSLIALPDDAANRAGKRRNFDQCTVDWVVHEALVFVVNKDQGHAERLWKYFFHSGVMLVPVDKLPFVYVEVIYVAVFGRIDQKFFGQVETCYFALVAVLGWKQN
ncbi:hypothetical protein BpHYR1_041132 [Brachionus plicatilis]|uniref:Secreted protein n=1 Tax=Brachionus plicatilis TaxID=10195 RepID=A0A3M7PYW7_BRAPC|nr:hypothetical protein BpHYR1_041132 [Brachionus plicatilis]